MSLCSSESIGGSTTSQSKQIKLFLVDVFRCHVATILVFFVIMLDFLYHKKIVWILQPKSRNTTFIIESGGVLQ